jgi:hypothetical protein
MEKEKKQVILNSQRKLASISLELKEQGLSITDVLAHSFTKNICEECLRQLQLALVGNRLNSEIMKNIHNDFRPDNQLSS